MNGMNKGVLGRGAFNMLSEGTEVGDPPRYAALFPQVLGQAPCARSPPPVETRPQDQLRIDCRNQVCLHRLLLVPVAMGLSARIAQSQIPNSSRWIHTKTGGQIGRLSGQPA